MESFTGKKVVQTPALMIYYIIVLHSVRNESSFTTLISFGVLLPELVEDFNSTKSAVSWAGSLVPGLYMGYVHDFAYQYIYIYLNESKLVSKI